MLERLVWIIVGLLVFVVGFFFLAAAVVAGLVIATVVLIRLWWLKRKLAQAADSEVITTEYTVVERELLPTESERGRDDGSPRTDRGP